MTSHLSALQRLRILAKAEGSRGGHITGHTKTGKPIYEKKGLTQSGKKIKLNEPPTSQHYQNFTAQDHLDAAKAHNTASETAASRGNETAAMSHAGDAAEHEDAAARLSKSFFRRRHLMELAKGRGEGSRGGHITGHTRSGKAIYAAGSGRTFSAMHADFGGLHETPHEHPIDGHDYIVVNGKSVGGHPNPGTRMVVPLHDGFSAQHHITLIHPDEGHQSVSGSWKVHAGTGEITGHKLDQSFIDAAKDIADEHKAYVSEIRT